MASEGNQWAGMRAWRYGADEISLWWAPGPTEPLLLSNAIVMLEATHDPDKPPRVLAVEAANWQGRPAFLFREDWYEGRAGLEGGQAQVWVVQGDDYWLYVLRMRTIRPPGAAPTPGPESISPLLREVGQTFRFQKR